MLTNYFSDPQGRLRLIRDAPAAPYFEGSIAMMVEAGFIRPRSNAICGWRLT
jgi:hypothetical protein